MRFTWDEDKAEAVSKDHAIYFAQIIDIFSDPCAVEFIDEAHSTESETRYSIIGLTAAYGLVYLVFTQLELDDQVDLHFVSARRAEPWMVKEYEENKQRQ